MSVKKVVCAAVLAAFTCFSLGGCYGSYALFNKVHKWNGRIGDKWINSVVHFVIVGPVYTLCMFGDFLIFNTIEFWTGSNPIAMGDTYQETDKYGNQVYAMKNPDGTLSVKLADAGGNKVDFMLERNGNVVKMIDSEGIVIAQHVVEE